MSAVTTIPFEQARATLFRIRDEMQDSRILDVDRMAEAAGEAARAHKVCKDRIAAVRGVLAEVFAEEPPAA